MPKPTSHKSTKAEFNQPETPVPKDGRRLEGKTAEIAVKALKAVAPEMEGVISVKVGVRRYDLPVKARLIEAREFLYLSFGSCTEVYRFVDGALVPMSNEDEGTEAFEKLCPRTRRRRRRTAAIKTEAPTD